MTHRIQFGLDDDDYALAVAHSADRHIPIADLARSALMSSVKRDAGRGGLMAEIDRIVRVRVADALAGRAASAEAHETETPE
jgi:hypothetical protein